MTTQTEQDGIVTVPSRHSMEDTLAKFKALIDDRKLTLFAQIDFSGDAKRAGLTMQPSQLLVFGNPHAGTPLMQAIPTIALDLPLKVLVWEDATQHVWMTYNAPDYIQRRHSVPQDLMKPLLGLAGLVNTVAGE